jgi:putative oxidoreductase
MKIVRLATRLLIGGLFVGHGTQKLIGAFEGPGIDGTEQMMEKIGMHPPRANAYAAAVTETAGGAMFALGRATPLAGAALIGTMVTAIRKVHAPNGPWITKSGWEYNAVLIAAITAIIEDEYNIAAALAALGLGAAASAAVIQSAEQAQVETYPTDAPAVDQTSGSADQGDTGTVTPEEVRAELRRSA